MIALTYGPVAIAVEGENEFLDDYAGGIINDPRCGTNLDHAVTLVGYGTENGVGYWLVKNSWGADWGENGYFRVFRDYRVGPGMCGILMDS